MAKVSGKSRAKDVLHELEGSDRFNAVVDLAARRGFFHPSAAIYGGLAGFYDYGPAGAAMKRKMESAWVDYWTRREGFFLLDTPSIAPRIVFRASGHLDRFTDPSISCQKCGMAFRADEYFTGLERRDQRLAKLSGDWSNLLALWDFLGGDLLTRPQSRSRREPREEAATWSGRYIRDFLTHVSSDAAPGWDEVDPSRLGLALDRISSELSRIPEPRDRVFKLMTDLRRAAPLSAIESDGSVEIRLKCPKGGEHEFDLRKSDLFNLMFGVKVGITREENAYLRPETAQGIFWNFPTLLRANRGRVPFGVIQLGLGYRNEIAPRQAIFRLREFHMAEVEVFVAPDAKVWPRFHEVEHLESTFVARDGAIHLGSFADVVRMGVIRSQAVGHFMAASFELLRMFGMPEGKIRFRQHMPEEMAHYAQDVWDMELETSLGWIECVGIADRGSYDLTRHQEYSGADMSVFVAYDEPKMVDVDGFLPDFKGLGPQFRGDAAAVGEAVRAAKPSQLQADGSLKVKVGGKDVVVGASMFRREQRTEKKAGDSYVPHVIEPSFGVDRILFGLLDAAFSRVEKEGEAYTILKLDPRVAPVTVSVFPLMPKDGLDEVAARIHREFVAAGIDATFDEAGSIGKRYARADEAGTAWCITVDYDSLADKAATLRSRDTQVQERVPIGGLVARVRALLGGGGTP